MQVFVETLTGGTLTIDFKNDDTILDIKLKIQNKTGIPPAEQKILHLGKFLSDELYVAPLKLEHVGTIHLIQTKPCESQQPIVLAPPEPQGHKSQGNNKPKEPEKELYWRIRYLPLGLKPGESYSTDDKQDGNAPFFITCTKSLPDALVAFKARQEKSQKNKASGGRHNECCIIEAVEVDSTKAASYDAGKEYGNKAFTLMDKGGNNISFKTVGYFKNGEDAFTYVGQPNQNITQKIDNSLVSLVPIKEINAQKPELNVPVFFAQPSLRERIEKLLEDCVTIVNFENAKIIKEGQTFSEGTINDVIKRAKNDRPLNPLSNNAFQPSEVRDNHLVNAICAIPPTQSDAEYYNKLKPLLVSSQTKKPLTDNTIVTSEGATCNAGEGILGYPNLTVNGIVQEMQKYEKKNQLDDKVNYKLPEIQFSVKKESEDNIELNVRQRMCEYIETALEDAFGSKGKDVGGKYRGLYFFSSSINPERIKAKNDVWDEFQRVKSGVETIDNFIKYMRVKGDAMQTHHKTVSGGLFRDFTTCNFKKIMDSLVVSIKIHECAVRDSYDPPIVLENTETSPRFGFGSTE